MITHRPYPNDVSDAEWQFVIPYLCLLSEDAGQRVYNLRDDFDAARWLVRSGSPWRYLPKDFPPWGTVQWYFRLGKKDGIFDRLLAELRGDFRATEGRHRQPSAAILDTQSVKTTEKRGSAVTMRARSSWGGSGTSSWTRSVC